VRRCLKALTRGAAASGIHIHIHIHIHIQQETLPMNARMTSWLAAGLVFTAGAAQAQVPQYGTSINYETARKVVAAAIADAKRQSLPMAVAVVDNAGQLVAFERMDNTQTVSIQVS
jgi:hypothetical protein